MKNPTNPEKADMLEKVKPMILTELIHCGASGSCMPTSDKVLVVLLDKDITVVYVKLLSQAGWTMTPSCIRNAVVAIHQTPRDGVRRVMLTMGVLTKSSFTASDDPTFLPFDHSASSWYGCIIPT